MPPHPQVQAILDGLASVEGPSLEDGPPAQARAMYKNLMVLGGTTEVARTEDRSVPGPAGANPIPVRVYWPTRPAGDPPGVLVWLHGGGWVIGDLDTADPTARALCEAAGVVVVSVDYRLSPEHPAPAAQDDAVAAVAWVAAHAAELGADPARLAVGGDSAGGNLAALVSQRAAADGGPAIRFQLLVYPVTDLTQSHASVDENAEGYLLTKSGLAWFIGHHLGDGAIDPKDPLVSPLHADSLVGLPPALVVTAEYDPLRDEGEAYAARLRDAGVTVEARRYDGQIHGFFGMDGLLDDAKAAVAHAGQSLREALA